MRRAFFALPLVLAAAGCGRSPATTFLAIDPAPPAGPPLAGYRGALLRVPFVHVPVALDRPEFAHEVAGTIKVEDFSRWAAPLGILARDTLIRDLQARLPAGAVLPPDAAPVVPETRVEVTVTGFRADGGEAVMEASYRIVPTATPALRAPPARPVTATLRAPLAADTPQAQAQAWSALLGQLADRITGALGPG